MGKRFLLVVTFFLFIFQAILSTASGQGMFETDKEGSVTARVANVPLAEVLRNFCATFNLDLKGTPTNEENINFTMTKGNFDEALKRLMRGHNYVLIQDAASGKPTLILLGKAERTKYTDDPPVARPAAGPPSYASPVVLPSQPSAFAAAAPPPSQAPQGSPLPSNAPSAEPRKQPDEGSAPSVVASARPTYTQSPSNATMPPMPPNIPGLELPPMPPTLEQARTAQSGVATTASSASQPNVQGPPQTPGENSSGQTSPQTPPSIPSGPGQDQQKARPTVDLRDLTPPPIPF